MRRKEGASARPIACSWPPGHHHVPTEAENHRHHQQHSQHCAHHDVLNPSEPDLSGPGSWLRDAVTAIRSYYYGGSADPVLTIAQRVIFSAGSAYG